MKKISIFAFLIFLVILSCIIGILNTFFLCAAAFLLLIIITIFIYSLFYRKQKDNEIWEDEP
ncbi:MAG: hypothetical protein ACOX7H_01815 [Bacillota bacterium]|jgi:uncharacterized membrane protein YqiK